MTDESLALGLKQGDRECLTALVEKYHRLLLGYLFRLTGGNQALSEDLVQETFLRLLRSIAQYQASRPFKPWLYAIATNLARDHYKRAEVRQVVTVPVEVGESGLETSSNPPEDCMLARDEVAGVVEALNKLPEHQREALILRYYQELSLAEIEAALNIPLGTVKSRLSLGLARLRALLEER